MNILQKDIDRFWSHVSDKNENGCRLWTSYRNSDGYGKFRLNGKSWSAHRFSYMIHFGNLKEMQVLHHCDTPHCVEPTHLWLGTQQENIKDMCAKGRRRGELTNHYGSGENHIGAKLTEKSVKLIRDIYSKGGITFRELAEQYGVSKGCISGIIWRINWKDVK